MRLSKKIKPTELNQKNYQSLLFALIAVLLPHFFYMPISLSILMSLVLITWQALIWYKGSYQLAQNKFLQYSVVFLGLAIIYLNFKTFFGVNAGCAAMALILLGKAFEVKTYRDAIIQINFALFVLASLFLYGQELYLALAALIDVFICLYSMYQLQNYNNAYEEVIHEDVSSKTIRNQAIKTVLKLLIVASPLMVLLFFFFPRIPPLWSIPQPSHQAKTGVSDEISPGDIAELSQSSELAFRVIFNDFAQMPKKSELYWRALVLEDFDGIRWRQHYQTRFSKPRIMDDRRGLSVPEWFGLKENQTNNFRLIPYKMIIEPSFQVWSYALEHSVGKSPLLIRSDATIYLNQELFKRQSFDFLFVSPNPTLSVNLDKHIYDNNIAVVDENPKTQKFAKEMQEKNPNPHAFAQAILNWIRQENFAYTLSPPLLSGDRIDDFLFRTRSGFCEHYASAYANLMRMAGIPARVVVGYQGGQWAPDRKSWEVRQLDAHAWTEVWFENQGWVRIDPTAAIAPERIENGMQQFSQQNVELFGNKENSEWQAQRYQWLVKSRVWMDYANYQWQSKVVGFDRDKQSNWLKSLSIENLSQQLIYLILGISVMIGLMVWWLSRQQLKKISSLDKSLMKLSLKLTKYGLQRQANEPIVTWLKRIEVHMGENQILTQIQGLYIHNIYVEPLEGHQLSHLCKLVGNYANNLKIIEKT